MWTIMEDYNGARGANLPYTVGNVWAMVFRKLAGYRIRRLEFIYLIFVCSDDEVNPGRPLFLYGGKILEGFGELADSFRLPLSKPALSSIVPTSQARAYVQLDDFLWRGS